MSWEAWQGTRRRKIGALGSGVVAGMVVGCRLRQGGPGGEAARAVTNGPPVEVTFMRPADQYLAQAYQAQAETFNKKQGRIKASFDPQAGADYGGWLTKLTTMLVSGTIPDCFLVNQDVLPGIAAMGSLLALDPYLRRDAKTVELADFFPSHVEAGKWWGQQMGLTPDGCAILEYYNVTLFGEAGVPVPRPSWTWSDYLDAARRLTKRDGEQIVQVGIGTVPSGNQLLPWLWSNGADVFGPDFKTVRVAERPAVDALQFVVDLVQKHGVTSASPGTALGGNATVEGKVAMWRGNRGGFGGLVSASGFKFNVVPIARAPQGSFATTVTTPGHIAIARANKRPDAAWEWLKYLTSTEAQIIRSEIAGGCPSRKSATQDASYKDYSIPTLESTAANKTFADVLADSRTARFIPAYVKMGEALGMLSNRAGAAIRGEVGVPAALEAARKELDELVRQFPQPAG